MGRSTSGRIERRDDVLVYRSAPLESDLFVAGPILVTLFVSTSARDTDFTARLIDLYPNGYAQNICEGIVRGRYRDPWIEPSLLSRARSTRSPSTSR